MVANIVKRVNWPEKLGPRRLVFLGVAPLLSFKKKIQSPPKKGGGNR